MYNSILNNDLNNILKEFSKEYFKGLKVLVTGGAGFIGSWLCDTLVKLNADVTSIDNLSTGRLENISHLIGFKNFRYMESDVSKFDFKEHYDIILHAASIPLPDAYIEKPVETMIPNSIGLLNILEYSRKHDSMVLYLSTSEVYGNSGVIPTPESYYGIVNPVGVRSCYDESKRFGEALSMAYYREYDLDIRIIRLFNSYGPRIDTVARYARVIPRFIIQALKNKPITVHGDGSQTRSFCYITDTVRALLKMMICDECKGEAVNVGSPNEITIIGLAKMIKELTGSNSEIVYMPRRPDDPYRRCPDISKAIKLLKWTPKVSLEDGLKYTIEWFRSVV